MGPNNTTVVIGVVIALGLLVSPVAASHTSGDATLTDGGTHWIGQDLYTDTFDPGDSVQLRRGSPSNDRGFVTQVHVLSDGGVLLDTRRRSPDTYYLTNGQGTTVSFDLVSQQYTVGADSSTIAVSSNRGSYRQKVTSPDLPPSRLDKILGVNGTVQSDGVVIEGSSDQSISLALSGLASGTYTITFHVTDTAASDNVTITIAERGQVSLGSRVLQGPVGSVVAVPLTFTNTKTARVTIGSRDLNWKQSIRVADTDGDGSATLQIDTENIRQKGSVFSATGGAVSNVTLDVGTRFSSPDRRIAAEAYPISVSTDGTETDVGTMSLTDPSGTVCDRSSGSILQIYDSNVGEVPGLLSGRISNATIHGVVTDDANRDYTVVTGANKQVSRFSAGVPSNPSLEVETDCDTVTRVMDAEEPDQAFSSAYDDGDIEVGGVGLVNTVIVEVLKVGYTIGQALGLL